MRDQRFRHCFINTEASNIQDALSKCRAIQGLHTAIENLEKRLGDYVHKPNDPLFTLVFDEVHGLISKSGHNGPVVALNRVISTISNHRTWFLFLSTEPILSQILSQDEFSSDQPAYHRVLDLNAQNDSKLEMFPPFTDFAVDITDLDESGGGFFLDPRQECMGGFGETMHMAKFGRPLWLAYEDASIPPDQIARVKLIGGNPKKCYDARNFDHVLAALSARICIDLNVANPITIPIANKAVYLHMRRLELLDSSTGLISTRTPTEPIIAKAAMQILCKEVNWAISLNTFTRNLLERGAIEKGAKGELFVRLIFTLAHDALMCELKLDLYESTLPTFTVHDFLGALFARSHHESLRQIDSNILNSHMNFLGFTSTQRCLRETDSKSFKHLCYSLLRRSMALQLAPQEETFDQLIPFYCDSLDEKPFDVDKVGAILVQIKCRKQEDTFKNITDSDSALKRLFLLVDLGSDENSVNLSVSEYSSPDIWAIHVNGHGEEVFSCAEKHKAQEYAERFFNNMSISSEKHIAFVHDNDLLDNVARHDKFCEVPEAASVPSTRKRKAGNEQTCSAPTRVTPRREKKKKMSYSS